jgi:hypothetical protein
VQSSNQDRELVRGVRALQSGLLSRDEIERYRRLDPANARLRSLHHDLIQRGAWQLLWVPPSLPYYQGTGPFALSVLSGFTKRLVFSSWRVVPKAVAAILSYEAERCMIQSFCKGARNTPESRKKRRPLLRFTFAKGRPTGMPVLGLIFPCRTLAEQFDPLQSRSSDNGLPTLDAVLSQVETRIGELLRPITAGVPSSGPADESWYWAAPLLLDLQHDPAGMQRWFAQDDLTVKWSSESSTEDHESSRGWSRHVQLASDLVDGHVQLGPPPEDLARVLAFLAIGSPGVTAYRALRRIAGTDADADTLRSSAAPLAHSFLHLFNLPEVMYLLRDRRKETPYWRSVLDYCAAGNLQAVLDEYAHVLVESLGLLDKEPETVATEVSQVIQRCLTLRTSTAQADLIDAGPRRVRMADSIRLRTRFAMRFGDQDAEDGSAPTRADHVRGAFNSPFWPFVLATTSVGQEGLDFHPYCHAEVHWNLPSNPVDLEQREGRVHRYKGHALRRNIAQQFASAIVAGNGDPWRTLFGAARQTRSLEESELFPFWIAPNGSAKIERHVPALPHSRERLHKISLSRSLVLCRMVYGQNRQEDLIEYLSNHVSPEDVARVVDLYRVDLAPPTPSEQFAGG